MRPASPFEIEFLEASLHHLPCFKSVETLKLSAALIHLTFECKDIDFFKAMALAGSKVIEVVCWRHLDCTRSESAVYQNCIRNYRNLSIQKWVLNSFVVQMAITRVVGVYRHSCVTQHGLRAGRRNDQLGRAERYTRIDDWVSKLVELPLNIFVTLNF